MISVNFTDDVIQELDTLRFNHPHPKIQQRCHALWMRSQGFKRSEITKVSGLSKTTYTDVVHAYVEKGIDGLTSLHYPKHRSDLYNHTDEIVTDLKANPPATVAQAQSRIEELTGIRRSLTQVRLFLKKQGFQFRKVGCIPSKADVDKQKAFKEDELMPRIKEAQEKKRAIFFVDAAHFVMGAFLGYLWCCVRLFVKTPSGRKRFNVLGAVEAITKKLVTVTNDTYITAESVCDLLKEIADLNLGIPITLVMDNARYQRCKKVEEYALKLDIELLFLPSYSPNLNLIERLWKFVKKKCLYSHYYENFASFKNGITECLSKTECKYKAEINSLLAPKFQTFKTTNILNK